MAQWCSTRFSFCRSPSSSSAPSSSSCHLRWNVAASRPHWSDPRFATFRETTPSLASSVGQRLGEALSPSSRWVRAALEYCALRAGTRPPPRAAARWSRRSQRRRGTRARAGGSARTAASPLPIRGTGRPTTVDILGPCVRAIEPSCSACHGKPSAASLA